LKFNASRMKNNKMSLKKKLLIFLAVTAAVLVCCACGYIYYVLDSMSRNAVPIVSGSANIDYEEPDVELVSPDASYGENGDDTEGAESSDSIYEQAQLSGDIINILLIGRDSRDAGNDRGRSDTMILLSYNSREGKAALVSLMRDILVPIDGHGWNRLNSAFSWGGIGLCINTINANFDLDIQKYIIIDFEGMIDLVDEIGGIDVTITEAEAELYRKWGLDITAGEVHMDGETALRHARNRDIGNDFGRTSRQRDILIAFYKKALSSINIKTAPSFISFALEKIDTNLEAAEIITLAANVLSSGGVNKIETGCVPKSGTWKNAVYNGMSILKIDIEENTEYLHSMIYGD